MKCDELERHTLDVWEDMSMYEPLVKASDVDAAIDELKTEHHKERDEYIIMVYSREQTIKELKAKLESVQASMYCDVVDTNMENRRLKHALWLARAEWARSSALSYHLIESHPDKDVAATYKRKANRWERAKDKCLKKAEEYR